MTTAYIAPNNHQNVKIHPTVWKIGLMMFLMNLGFMMGYSYFAIYMDSFGVSMVWIGVAEGIAEGGSQFMKLFSGLISDYFRRRKPIMVLGYSISVLSRILYALSSTFLPFFCGRLGERLANGTQSTPRDTMVADVVPAKQIGSAYGLKRMLSQAGAFIGAIISMFAMRWFNNDIQSVFQVAVIPAILAYCILVFFIKEPKHFSHSAVSSEIPLPEEKRRHPISFKNLPLLGKSFWMLMLVAAIFMLSRFSEGLLCLYGLKNFDLSLENVPLVPMVYNATWCLTAYPVGRMADRMNRYWFLIIGILFLILADMILADAESLSMFWVGIALWGVQMAITMNIFLSLIAEIVPEDLRGTGFGCYYVIIAISELFASNIAGVVSQNFGQSRMFLASGIIAAFSLLVLIVIMGYKSKK